MPRLKLIFSLHILSLALVSVLVATVLKVPNGGLLAGGLPGGALALSLVVQAMLRTKYDPELQIMRPITALRIPSLTIALILVAACLKVRSGETWIGFLFGMAIGVSISLLVALLGKGIR